MSEQNPYNPERRGNSLHKKFIEDRENSIVNNAKKVLGATLITTGAAVSLEAIFQVFIGSPTGALLADVDAISFLTTMGKNFSETSVAIKAGGGVSMMSLGEMILKRAARR